MGSTAPAPGSPDARSASRVLLTRVLPAILGMAVLFVCAYLGLGYLVWKRNLTVPLLFGNHRAARLERAYATAADTFLPRDRDGDGASDGVELFQGTDPQVAQAQLITIEWQRPDFLAYDYPSILPAGSTRGFVYYEALPEPGRPVHLRGRLAVLGRHHRMPPGYSLRVTPPPGTALGLPGAPGSADPLLLPVDPTGRFAFDIHRLPDAVVDLDSTLGLTIANARTGQSVETVDVRYLPAAGPPLPVRRVPLSLPVEKHVDTYGDLRTEEIEWPRAPAGTRALLLQAARPEPDAPWISLQLYPPDQTTATVAHLLREPRYPYTGPLRYRVLPLGP